MPKHPDGPSRQSDPTPHSAPTIVELRDPADRTGDNTVVKERFNKSATPAQGVGGPATIAEPTGDPTEHMPDYEQAKLLAQEKAEADKVRQVRKEALEAREAREERIARLRSRFRLALLIITPFAAGIALGSQACPRTVLLEPTGIAFTPPAPEPKPELRRSPQDSTEFFGPEPVEPKSIEAVDFSGISESESQLPELNTDLLQFRLLLKRERYGDAMKLINSLLKENPNNSHLLYLKAELLELRGRKGGAKKHLEQAIENLEGEEDWHRFLKWQRNKLNREIKGG